MGFSNPDISWGELKRPCPAAPTTDALSIRLPATAVTARPGRANGRPTSPPAPVAAPGGALRRTALPLELLVPRPGVTPGVGRRGRPARSGSPRPHRPQQLLRRGAVRRGGRAVDLPTIFGAELTLAEPGRALNVPVRPTLPGVTSSSLPAIPVATPCSVARSARPTGGRRAPRIPYERLVELGGQGTGDH